MLVHLLPACPIPQRKLPLLRAHGHLSRLSHIFMVQYRRREPASPTRFPSIRVQFLRREHAPRALFPSAMVRVRRRVPVLTVTFPSAAAKICQRGYAFQTPPPSTMAREPALHAPLPPATRRAAMRLLQRRVALLSERVHPLLVLTRWWRSVWGVGRSTLKHFFPAMRWRSV